MISTGSPSFSSLRRSSFGGGRPLVLGLVAAIFFLAGCGSDAGEAPEDGGVEAAAPDAPRGAPGVVLEPRGTPAPDSGPPTSDTLLPSADMAPEDPAHTEPPSPEQPSVPLPSDTLSAQVDTLRGEVGVTGTGTVPTAVLRLETGDEVGLTGDLARELRSLAGGTVEVWGRRAASPVGPGLEVADYRLLEVEGRTPHVGFLEGGPPGDWILQERHTEEEFVLVGMPGTGVQSGMLVWVVGTQDAQGRIAVEFHGVIQLDSR